MISSAAPGWRSPCSQPFSRWPECAPSRRNSRRTAGFLLIFDTSSNMKRRVSEVEKSLNTMLATSMSGQLHKGDTIGVWAFDQNLHPGDFPLQQWNPENAVLIASNITHFVHSRKYANTARFEALQPLLGRVVDGSERLTVLVFSDGATKITGTTFDTGINQLFQENAAAQKKAHEPFVVVLRSQQGKYVGCTVTYAPQVVSFPQFPPLPPPEPPPAPKPAPVVAPAPAVVVPSIIITGTNVEGHLTPSVSKPAPTSPPPAIQPAPAMVAPTSAPVVATAIAPVDSPVAQTNLAAAAPVNPPAPAPVPAVMPTSNLNVPAAAETPVAAEVRPSGIDKKPLIIGAVCLIATGIVTALVVFCFRRPNERSLISSSMHDK